MCGRRPRKACHYNPGMRFWLAVLLWALLPLQLSWAGGCGDGPCAPVRPTAVHACPQAAGEHPAAESHGLAAGLDCEICHAHGGLAGPPHNTSGASPGTPVFADIPPRAPTSPPLSRPERPQWPA